MIDGHRLSIPAASWHEHSPSERTRNRHGAAEVQGWQWEPTSVYVWLGGVCFVGSVLVWAFMGFRKGSRRAAGLLLIAYLFWIDCMTVMRV